MNDTNLLGEAINLLKDTWRHRPGYEIPATVLDTVDALWPEDKPRPLLIKGGVKKTPSGWHMIFTLRPGVRYRDIEGSLEYFIDACRLPATIEKVGGYAHLHVYNDELADEYPYEWNPHQYVGGKTLPFPVGYSQEGLVIADLVKFPHLLIAGETGYGKSTMLLVLVLSLLPLARIVILDPKRTGYTFLKRHCLVATKDREILNILKAANAEMEKRIDILEETEISKIQNYKGDVPYIVLVMDEVAQIRDKEAIYYIDRMSSLSRATGIHLVAATQRPSKKVKVFEENCRDMFAGRICYYMPDEISSRLVLGETCSLAAKIPAKPGRGVYKYGHIIKEIQTMNLGDDEVKQRLKGVDKVVRWEPVRPSQRLLPR